MDNKSSWYSHIFLMLFMFFTVSSVMAGDDVEAVSAGDDQSVNTGDMVSLSGVITFEKEKNHDDHGSHWKGHHHGKGKKKGHDKHHRRHKKYQKYEDELVIKWTQTAGSPVTLSGNNTLTPSFIAPGTAGVDEVLSFTLDISDDDGELLASDLVSVTVVAPPVLTSFVTGRVSAVDGTEISNVTVNVLSAGSSLATAVSGTNGQFSIEIDANTDAVLQLTADGYADQVVPVRSPVANANVFIEMTMIARGTVQSFSAVSDATLSGDDGSSVSVLAGSFVDANGVAVTAGNIDLTITPVDVSSPSSLAAFPGEFSGILEGAVTDSPIISLGTVEFEFTQNGQPLQLAPGQTADIVIPMYFSHYPDGSAVNVGDTIPLWSLNEDTGIWQQEGVGTVITSADSATGFAMAATVGHFSWWNCDVSYTPARAIVTVTGASPGTALIKARTSANIGWRPNTVETVAAINTPTPGLFIPVTGEVCFWAEVTFDNGFEGITAESCVTAAANAIVNIELPAPAEGPVSIYSSPVASAGVINIAGNVDYAVDKVYLQSSTFESDVSYSIISGSLPAGVTLNTVNAVRAEIAGVPTEAGNFSVVVQALDNDGFTDTITINYAISADVPAPLLQMDWINYNGNSLPDSYNMNVYNIGGLATSWSLDYNPLLEEVALPSYVSINSVTGVLTITEACRHWQGFIIATNATGSSKATIVVSDGSCG